MSFEAGGGSNLKFKSEARTQSCSWRSQFLVDEGKVAGEDDEFVQSAQSRGRHVTKLGRTRDEKGKTRDGRKVADLLREVGDVLAVDRLLDVAVHGDGNKT